jgi:DNA-binding Lrp family transcriptional regulator
MLSLPPAVAKAYARIKLEYPFFVSLKCIHGKYYYLYKQSTKWDKESKKLRGKSEYLGKFTPDGKFIAKLRGAPKDLEKAINVVKAYGGNVTMPEEAQDEEEAAQVQVSGLDKKLLTELSMDARVSAGDVAKHIGITVGKAAHRIKDVISRYAIRPTIEIKPDTFGFTRYLVTVKFLSKEPDYGAVREVLGKEPKIQLVMVGEGDYNIIIYLVIEDIHSLERLVYEIRSNPVFASYPSRWHATYLEEPYGWYMPMRDEFFDILKERVWHRSKEYPRKLSEQLLFSEYAVMKELNRNSRIKFSEVDKRYGFNKGHSSRIYEKLLERKTIKRSTIIMGKSLMKYPVFFYLEQLDIGSFNAARKSFLANLVEETDSPINKYMYTADVASPYGTALMAPVLKDGESEKLKEGLNRDVKGIALHSTIVTSILVGSLGVRRFDTKKSSSYEILQSLIEKENALPT